MLNVINIVTGVGLLSVPFALRRAGWAGLGILWLMGFVMNYTGARPGHSCCNAGQQIHIYTANSCAEGLHQPCQLAAELNHAKQHGSSQHIKSSYISSYTSSYTFVSFYDMQHSDLQCPIWRG